MDRLRAAASLPVAELQGRMIALDSGSVSPAVQASASALAQAWVERDAPLGPDVRGIAAAAIGAGYSAARGLLGETSAASSIPASEAGRLVGRTRSWDYQRLFDVAGPSASKVRREFARILGDAPGAPVSKKTVYGLISAGFGLAVAECDYRAVGGGADA